MKEKEIKQLWKEIIYTANNKDPKYSYDLFRETIKRCEKQ